MEQQEETLSMRETMLMERIETLENESRFFRREMESLTAGKMQLQYRCAFLEQENAQLRERYIALDKRIMRLEDRS